MWCETTDIGSTATEVYIGERRFNGVVLVNAGGADGADVYLNDAPTVDASGNHGLWLSVAHGPFTWPARSDGSPLELWAVCATGETTKLSVLAPGWD